MDILARLTEFMEYKGWSMNRLAKEAGITQSTLSSIFSRQAIPSIPTLKKLCSGLDITLGQFFADQPPELPPDARRVCEKVNRLPPDKLQILESVLDSWVEDKDR